MTCEKKVIYTTTNTYSVLNSYTEKTKNVWIVFHGLGYLSKYFIKYFSEIDTEENFIIAPQAPSKYYQDKKFKHVGASWLTKENTAEETKNVLAYVDEVYKTEVKNTPKNLIVLGYSQGVSIATRWVASRKIDFQYLVLHSGGIPNELKQDDFSFLNKNAKVTYLYGNKDQYINEARKTEEEIKGNKLFGNHLNIKVFNGIHEVNTDYIRLLSKTKIM
ncbi:MAG: esterase [Flavobacteriaceae bacterium]|nr:esterase [Flavobacteriaceae bacterium]